MLLAHLSDPQLTSGHLAGGPAAAHHAAHTERTAAPAPVGA